MRARFYAPSLVLLLLTLVAWVWTLARYNRFGLFGGDGRLDRYNAALSEIRNILFFQHLPDVTIEDDRPFDSKRCVVPLFVGEDSDDNVVDCKRMCHDETANSFTVVAGQTTVVAQKQLGPGKYCLLGPEAACNPYTTTALYAAGGWSCFPKFAELGGIGGNKILACGGKLRDNLTNTTFDQYIPSNLPIDLGELLEDGSYRFECAERTHPVTGYTLAPATESNRFVRITNPCTMGIENALDVKWDRTTGECSCEPPLEQFGSRCTNCPLTRASGSALVCANCYEPFLWRIDNQAFYPCIYGPHLFMKAPIKDTSDLFDKIDISVDELPAKPTDDDLEALGNLASGVYGPISYADALDIKMPSELAGVMNRLEKVDKLP